MKLHGPMHSLAASGSLANLLSYGTTRGRAFVRRSVKRRDARSPAQMNQRALLGFLQHVWEQLTGAEMAAWAELALRDGLPNYQAFVRYNLQAWTDTEGPRKVPTPPPAGPTASYIDSLVGTPGSISGRWIDYGSTPSWACGLFLNVDNPPLNARRFIRKLFQPTPRPDIVTNWSIIGLSTASYRVASLGWGPDGAPGIFYVDPFLINVP